MVKGDNLETRILSGDLLRVIPTNVYTFSEVQFAFADGVIAAIVITAIIVVLSCTFIIVCLLAFGPFTYSGICIERD